MLAWVATQCERAPSNNQDRNCSWSSTGRAENWARIVGNEAFFRRLGPLLKRPAPFLECLVVGAERLFGFENWRLGLAALSLHDVVGI